MPMNYKFIAISEDKVPKSTNPLFQHLLDTYSSETNKVISIWLEFTEQELNFCPHSRSSTVKAIMQHQLLSERRFFAEFIGTSELPATDILPSIKTPQTYASRMLELVTPRLAFLALQTDLWWLEKRSFFDVEKERIWIFWRRVLHTSHHRTQLTVYLRLLDKIVPSTYGPTADVTWNGADPTTTIESTSRK
jgi:uncharacterized damage-inducible protein DinB